MSVGGGAAEAAPIPPPIEAQGSAQLEPEELREYREDEKACDKLMQMIRRRKSKRDWCLECLDLEEARIFSAAEVARFNEVLAALKNFRMRRMEGENVVSAAEKAGELGCAHSLRAVLAWRSLFELRRGLWVSDVGKYAKRRLMGEEDISLRLTERIAEHSDKVGRPNLAAVHVQGCIDAALLPETCGEPGGEDLLRRCKVKRNASLKTAGAWMNLLGFQSASALKAGYCDGRNREDAQKRKIEHCQLMRKLQARMPIWTRMTAGEFRLRFPGELKPELWMTEADCVEFCVGHLSSEEIEGRGCKWGGDWSRRREAGMPERGIKESARVLLASQMSASSNPTTALTEDGGRAG